MRSQIGCQRVRLHCVRTRPVVRTHSTTRPTAGNTLVVSGIDSAAARPSTQVRGYLGTRPHGTRSLAEDFLKFCVASVLKDCRAAPRRPVYHPSPLPPPGRGGDFTRGENGAMAARLAIGSAFCSPCRAILSTRTRSQGSRRPPPCPCTVSTDRLSEHLCSLCLGAGGLPQTANRRCVPLWVPSGVLGAQSDLLYLDRYHRRAEDEARRDEGARRNAGPHGPPPSFSLPPLG